MLGLYLLFILTSSIPVVQEYAGKRVAGMLAHKLGTSVSIGRINFGMLNHLTLDDVLIKDQQGHDMLRAARLSASIDLFPLTEGKISIATAQLFATHANLYRATAESKPNFQFVLDSLASKDSTSTPLDLRINSLIIRRSSVRYDCYDKEETPNRINPNHIHLTSVSAHIVLKALTSDSLNVNIKRLAFKEKSGLQINRLNLRFEAGRNSCQLHDFLLRMPGTEFRIEDIKASYRFRGDHFVKPSLSYSGHIKLSTITLADISCLLPSLNTFHSTLSLSAAFDGQGNLLQVKSLKVGSTTGDISLDLSGRVRELGHVAPDWIAHIHDLALSAKTISFISENLKGERISVPDYIVRMGNIHLKGDASGKGTESGLSNLHLNTDAGNVDLSFSIDKQRHFKSKINTNNLDLKRLLSNNSFGGLAVNIQMSGQIPANGQVSVAADGIINSMEYNGYNYRNIKINGKYSPTDIQGRLNIDDTNIKIAFNGSIQKKDKLSHVSLTTDIDHLYPKAIRLSDLWGEASFSGKLAADFSASNINDAVGDINLWDFAMQGPKTNYHLNKMNITSGYDKEVHFMTLDSDFGEIDIRGIFDYKTLPQSFTNFIADKLPTFPGLPKTSPHVRNNFSISAVIKKTDWLQSLLNVPMRIDEPVRISATVNDPTKHINLYCSLPYFYYKDSPYINGEISITSPNDSLRYDIGVTKVMDDGTKMDLQALGNVINNTLFTSLIWNDNEYDPMSGRLNATVSFDTTADNKQKAYISIEPSQINIHRQQWDIEPAYIVYSQKEIDINNFVIRNDKRFLQLNGIMSKSEQDSVTISMKDIDVEYVLDLVNFHAVDFNGYATGNGILRGVLGDLEAEGALKVTHFEFEHGRMGTLDAKVNWNKEEKQIDINAIADDGPDAKTYVNGYVSPERNAIDLAIRAEGTHLDFAHSFTQSFIGHIEGHTNGEVRLAGALDAINLTGLLVLNGNAYVSTLGCTYELRNDTLRLVPNEIEFADCPLYDIYGNRAIMTGGIHHKELTNLTYDIYVKANNLLAYDFKDFGDDTFYGTIYATGNVAIQGRQDGVVIDADVIPQSNSFFVYNAAATNVIHNQEFIKWNNSTQAPAEKPIPLNTRKEEVIDDYRSDLTLRLKVNATPNATLRLLMDPATDDYITLKGNGDLQATYYNKGGFTMFGTYRVTEGTYGVTIQNIIKKNFTFREGGTIIFGGDPYDAALNLQAVHTVNGVSLSDLNVGKSFSNTVRVNCLMNITGQPRAPIVDFDLEMPNVNSDEAQMVRSVINGEEEMNQQVVYLLAVGRFYPQGANNDASESENSPSKTSLAMQSLLSGTLSGQINSVLNRVVKSNNWNFGANISTGDEGWNNAEYEGLISGRLLNNRLLINGQFGYRDNATTTTPSFIGDFDIRYLLYPSGNLALKVYNQTSDRYFTKSSLNTQGIGIILKKDFSSLSDLFGKKKKKKNIKSVKKP